MRTISPTGVTALVVVARGVPVASRAEDGRPVIPTVWAACDARLTTPNLWGTPLPGPGGSYLEPSSRGVRLTPWLAHFASDEGTGLSLDSGTEQKKGTRLVWGATGFHPRSCRAGEGGGSTRSSTGLLGSRRPGPAPVAP